MTTQEFSNEFDILYNNIMSNQAPGLDEYEKSVFLTKAQSELLKNYFNPKGNKYQEGFDDSGKRQYDFSKLIRVATLFSINTVKERITEDQKIDRRSIPFIFPEDYFISVNEVISDSKTQYTVIPLTHEEYSRLMLKPYAYPVKKAAWRLFSDKKNCNFYQSYIDNSEVDYKFLSTWADQRITLKVSFQFNPFDGSVDSSTTEGKDNTVEEGSRYVIRYNGELDEITIVCGWNDDNLIYEINFSYRKSAKAKTLEDDEFIHLLRNVLSAYKSDEGSDGQKAYERLDGLINFEAPSKFTNLSAFELTTEVIFLPIAEVIGRFSGGVQYKLRYIKKPKPIVLTDLSESEVSIEGVSKETQCELPSELHSEILQRAVELAKAAYTGDINSVIELGKRSE